MKEKMESIKKELEEKIKSIKSDAESFCPPLFVLTKISITFGSSRFDAS